MPYSTRLVCVHEDLSAGPSLYTCPDGYVVVFRDVSLRNQTGFSAVLQVGILVPGPVSVPWAQWDAVASNDVVEWQGRHVLEAGDQFWGYNSEGESQLLASGYLLVAP